MGMHKPSRPGSSCAPGLATSMADVQVPAGQRFSFYRRLKTPIWVFDIDGNCLAYANEAANRLWEADNEDEMRLRNFDDMSTTVRERLKQYQEAFVADDRSFSELWTLFPKGHPVHVKVVYTGFRLDDGRIAMMCEAQTDLDEEPETIRSAEALMHTDVMIALFSVDGEALYTNPSSRRSLIDASSAFRKRIDDTDTHAEILGELRECGEYSGVLQVLTRAGKRWHNISIKSCFDAVTGFEAHLVTEVDVSEMKAAEERERYLAHHDTLTGLYNRSFVQRYLEDPALFRSDCDDLSAVLYIDIDRFKSINDKHGHEFGDIVLKTVADRICSEVDPGEIVCRLGGDEFLALILAREGKLDALVEGVRERVAEPVIAGDISFEPSCSIGIAQYPDDGKDFATLIRHADLALYAAKNTGRQTHCYFKPSMQEEARQRLELEADLARAIEDKEFELYYQPRAEIASNRIVGVEGLLRWNHPERGLVLPGDFIPFCEESGLIETLGEDVLTLAARQQAEWAAMGHRIFVSVNLSPRQFHSERLLPLMRDLVNTRGVDPSLLEFEITESVLMGDNEQVLRTLVEIRDLGFHMALDDFGTGYSNLAYIPRYPIGCIKIDKSFIDQLPHSSAVIGLILSLGRQIGAKVVAEGVETPDQLLHLHLAKCAEYQGYLLERPQPVDQVTRFLDRQAEDFRSKDVSNELNEKACFG